MNTKNLPSHPRNRSSNIYQILTRLFFPMLLLLWIFFIFFTPSTSSKAMLRGSDKDNLLSKDKSIKTEIDAKEVRKRQIDHAVIVAGHAVMRLNQLSVADHKESAWYLLSYQIGQGFPEIITSHIQKGIEIANNDQNSLLIFSGGQTRNDVGPTSEAASYYYLAKEKNWIDNKISDRIYLDEFARDSFENLLFSICRFKEVLGYYPSKVTVIGFDFKGDRFSTLHRKAIKFPEERFTYIGIKPDNPFDYQKAVSGEQLALKSFTEDFYGCNDPALKQKREVRNPFRRTIPYQLVCPELRNLLEWCGPRIFPTELPWESK